MSKLSSTKLESLKKIIINGTIEQKIDALLDAVEYGKEGWDLIIQGLQDDSEKIRSAAYLLLEEIKDEKIEQTLSNYPFILFECKHTFNALEKDLILFFAISHQSKSLITAFGYSGTIKIWDLKTSTIIQNHYSRYDTFAISTQKSIFISAYQEWIRILDTTSSEDSYDIFDFFIEDCSYIKSMVVDSHGNKLFIGEKRKQQNFLTFYNLNTGDKLDKIKLETFCINRLLLSSDNKILLIDFFRCYELWDLETKELIISLDKKTEDISHYLAFTKDERYITCGIKDHCLTVWNPLTDDVLYSFPGNVPSTMTPDGSVLVYANERDVIIYNLITQEKIRTLKGHPAKVTHIALSPDKQAIASYSADGTIEIWAIPDV